MSKLKEVGRRVNPSPFVEKTQALIIGRGDSDRERPGGDSK
jgi:hypothetical protein